MNILVLCTGNSARSILLETILNSRGRGRIRAWSAGSRPAGRVHPQTLKLLQEKGHDIHDARSKSWEEFAVEGAPRMDVVITVCGSAAGEVCPVWPGAPIRAHWGVEDPAAADREQWDSAFRLAHDRLEGRARAFLDLPFETMDRGALQAALDRIGKIG